MTFASLTLPPTKQPALLDYGRRFVDWCARHGGGALLAVEPGHKAALEAATDSIELDGPPREHFHGLAFIPNPATALKMWLALPGTRAIGNRIVLVTGACAPSNSGAGFRADLQRVLAYSFKARSDGVPREISTDVLASGLFLSCLDGALARCGVDPSPLHEAGARNCAWCGASMADRRRNAVTCCAPCRKQLSKHRGKSRNKHSSTTTETRVSVAKGGTR